MRNNFFNARSNSTIINVGSNYSQEMREHKVLSTEQIQRIAPTVYADTAHSSRSARYVHIPTFDVIEGLRDNGFLPVHVQVSRTRDEDKQGHAKHIMRFRHKDELSDVRAHADWRERAWFEIIIRNAHDGTSGFDILGGMFRPICLNGLAHGDKTLQVKVPHKGKDCLQRVVEGAHAVLESKHRVLEARDLMEQTVLTEEEQAAYAQAMTGIRYAQSHIAKGLLPPVNPETVIGTVRREQDNGNELWKLFNRCQENLTQGGLRTNDETRRSYTRPITGMADLLANQAMWLFSQRVAEAKAG